MKGKQNFKIVQIQVNINWIVWINFSLHFLIHKPVNVFKFETKKNFKYQGSHQGR